MSMKVLWIVNTIFPDLSKYLGFDQPVFGGWMYSLSRELAISSGIRLAVATTYDGEKVKSCDIDGVIYFLLPARETDTYPKKLESHWQKICNEFKPDIIHIHGTEYLHGLACMHALPLQNYVVSIQGIVGVISRYYYAGIGTWEIFKNITFRDIIRSRTLFQLKRNFEKRGEIGKEYLRLSNHVIGRTTWDYVHAKTINPNINYYLCNESLRTNFYISEKWNTKSKTDYTIFLSQGSYPIKGLHVVLEAVLILKSDFPNIKVRVAGSSIISTKTLIEKIKLSGYGCYIKKIIKMNKLEGIIEFTGLLNEQQMITEYKNTHVFVCPSSIENSSNSIGEAQILGVPTIASYVGGSPDMIEHGKNGFIYRFEEVEMLAHYIRTIFRDDNLANKLSHGGIVTAEKRHDLAKNLQSCLILYKNIIKQK